MSTGVLAIILATVLLQVECKYSNYPCDPDSHPEDCPPWPQLVLKIDSITVGGKCIICVHTISSFFSSQKHFVEQLPYMPVAVDYYSVADRFLLVPCGANTSKERLQTTKLKQVR